MPVPMDVREKIEENLRLIESGKESYASVAKRYGTSKSTVFRIHIRKLEAAAKKTKEELKALKHEKKKLQTDFQGLEQKYQKKNQALQRTHKQRKQKLEQEVNRLEQEKTLIKSVLETQGLTWEDAGEILKDILDLRGEKAGYNQQFPSSRRKFQTGRRRQAKCGADFCSWTSGFPI